MSSEDGSTPKRPKGSNGNSGDNSRSGSNLTRGMVGVGFAASILAVAGAGFYVYKSLDLEKTLNNKIDSETQDIRDQISKMEMDKINPILSDVDDIQEQIDPIEKLEDIERRVESMDERTRILSSLPSLAEDLDEVSRILTDPSFKASLNSISSLQTEVSAIGDDVNTLEGKLESLNSADISYMKNTLDLLNRQLDSVFISLSEVNARLAALSEAQGGANGSTGGGSGTGGGGSNGGSSTAQDDVLIAEPDNADDVDYRLDSNSVYGTFSVSDSDHKVIIVIRKVECGQCQWYVYDTIPNQNGWKLEFPLNVGNPDSTDEYDVCGIVTAEDFEQDDRTFDFDDFQAKDQHCIRLDRLDDVGECSIANDEPILCVREPSADSEVPWSFDVEVVSSHWALDPQNKIYILTRQQNSSGSYDVFNTVPNHSEGRWFATNVRAGGDSATNPEDVGKTYDIVAIARLEPIVGDTIASIPEEDNQVHLVVLRSS